MSHIHTSTLSGVGIKSKEKNMGHIKMRARIENIADIVELWRIEWRQWSETGRQAERKIEESQQKSTKDREIEEVQQGPLKKKLNCRRPKQIKCDCPNWIS